jgi:histidyl-tRNA synthetase
MSDEQGAPRAQAPKGTHDVLWPESTRWESLVAGFAQLVERAGYGLTHTPIFEDASVFRRGIGETNDVVGKEMYEFTDRGGRHLALRPEGTAPMVRAYLQHRPPVPWKAWYVTPSFRYETPQFGRYRQHHQLGVEVLGTPDADVDVEVMSLAVDFFEGLGLTSFTLKINSMGDEVCRPAYLELLSAYLSEHKDELCKDHAARASANPLRVLDCKEESCRSATADAPHLVDHLCDPCREHFERVRSGLEVLGILSVLDFRLVRGFDYYTRTTFEFTSATLGATQDALGGGGRYDGLVELLGGPPTPGIGFGIGIERVLLACDADEVFAVDPPPLDAYVVDLTGGTVALELTTALRRAGLRADRAFDGRSMKSQLRSADRSGARLALIIGAKELEEGTVTIRALRGDNDANESQKSVPVDQVVASIWSEILLDRATARPWGEA